MKVDIKALIEALGELPKDAAPEQVLQFVQAELQKQEALEGKPAEEPPAPAPEAPLSAAPEVAASAVPAPAEAPAALAEEPTASPEGALAMDALKALMDATGMPAAESVAFLQENKDAIAALVGGASASGTASAEGSVESPMSRNVALSAATMRIEALGKDLSARDAKIAELQSEIAALGRKQIEAEVDALILNGTLTDSERDFAIELKSTQPALVEKWYATRGGAAVPVGRIAAKAGPTKSHDLSGQSNSQRAEYLRANFRAASPHASAELIEQRVAEAMKPSTSLNGRS